MHCEQVGIVGAKMLLHHAYNLPVGAALGDESD